MRAFLIISLIFLLPAIVTCAPYTEACSNNGDCSYVGNGIGVRYLCTNNGACHCGNAEVCECSGNNGACFCDNALTCECNNNNGDCSCGAADTCDCNNNGDCCHRPGVYPYTSYNGVERINSDGKCPRGNGAGSVIAVIASVLGFVLFAAFIGCCVFAIYRRNRRASHHSTTMLTVAPVTTAVYPAPVGLASEPGMYPYPAQAYPPANYPPSAYPPQQQPYPLPQQQPYPPPQQQPYPPPQQQPYPHQYPPHQYPPQAYPPQSYPPQQYPPTSYPPQPYSPTTNPQPTYPSQSHPTSEVPSSSEVPPSYEEVIKHEEANEDMSQFTNLAKIHPN